MKLLIECEDGIYREPVAGELSKIDKLDFPNLIASTLPDGQFHLRIQFPSGNIMELTTRSRRKLKNGNTRFRFI